MMYRFATNLKLAFQIGRFILLFLSLATIIKLYFRFVGGVVWLILKEQLHPY